MFFKFIKRAIGVLLTGSLLLSSVPALAAERLQDTGEKTVIVIDPGHGGNNRGTIENNHEEKYMTMITAQAMYDELIQYDNVEVYLTRTSDVTMKLKERAKFAAEKEADFLFSIHYNASENHELFGSEVWVSAFAPYNAYGYQFGYAFLSDMAEKGLFIRGVKTRLGDKKTEDYYGIIRESVALGVPAVIIEHCHVDEERDEIFCATEEQLREFGRADATAVAKYFGLKSSTLQVDFSDYPLANADENIVVPGTLRDDTKPDVCQIEFLDADYEKGLLSLTVSGTDLDSPLLYYDYSLDGGNTYSRREIWPDSDALQGDYTDTFTLNLEIPDGSAPDVVVRAYNMFDLFTESNRYTSLQTFSAPTPVPEQQQPETDETASSGILEQEIKQVLSSDLEENKKEVSLFSFLKICLAVVVFLFVILLVSQTISYRRRKKRRRLQQRKEAGNRKNQPR